MAVAHFPTRNMTDEEQIVAILEQILETDSDPAVACMDRPDLLSKVRRRLGRVRRVEHKLEELFPSSTESGESFTGPDRPASSRLPTVAGYDVGGILGRGGMGVVYKARHQKLNRLVALKMLRDGQFATSDELLHFRGSISQSLNCIVHTSYRFTTLVISMVGHSLPWNLWKGEVFTID